MRSFRTGALLVTVSLLGGCGRPTRILPADESAASKIKTELQAAHNFVVNERFVVLPVGWEDSKGYQGVLHLGSLTFKSSAWSQSAYGFSPSQGPGCGSVLNLVVADLDTGNKQRVFDHYVAAWVHPFTFKQETDSDAGLCSRCGGARQEKTALRYPGLLILIARTQDTNSDKQIDERDSEWLFAYDVNGGKLRRISPAGYRVEYMSMLKDTILAFMAPESAPLGNTNTLAIYKYDPKTDKGTLIKDVQ